MTQEQRQAAEDFALEMHYRNRDSTWISTADYERLARQSREERLVYETRLRELRAREN